MKLKSAINRIWGLAVALLFTNAFVFAQQSTGSLTGIIEDSQGAVIPGAMITLINQEQGSIARTAITNEDGTFVFTPLQPATYTLVVEMPGFKKYQKQGITLYAQDRIGLPPIQLEVGAVLDIVTVEASPLTSQTVSAERSGVLTGNQIADLASSTRVFTDLLKTIPGFNSDTNNANGLRTDQNALAVDGVSSMDTGNTVSSGAPVTPTYSIQGVGAATLNRQITGSEGWASRVVLTCDPNISRGDRTLFAYFNTSCFAPAAKGSTGMDSAIRPLRGPGLNNWDLSVFKKFGLGNDARRFLQLRLEMFNAFNHTQWNLVNSAAQFDATGKIINLPSALGGGGGRFGFGALGGSTGSGVRNPRNIQIAAKIIF